VKNRAKLCFLEGAASLNTMSYANFMQGPVNWTALFWAGLKKI